LKTDMTAPLDERGALEGDRAVWRFHPGRLVPRRIVAPEPSHAKGSDRSIVVGNDRFSITVGVIRVKVRAMNCIGNNRSPWHGGTRTGETEQGWLRIAPIMVPWPVAARAFG
jgi:hypothetical protein